MCTLPNRADSYHLKNCILFQLLENDIVAFVRNELKKIQKILSIDHPGCSETQRDDEQVLEGDDGAWRKSSREALLEMTMNFLRRMNEVELADLLQSSKRGCIIRGCKSFI